MARAELHVLPPEVAGHEDLVVLHAPLLRPRGRGGAGAVRAAAAGGGPERPDLVGEPVDQARGEGGRGGRLDGEAGQQERDRQEEGGHCCDNAGAGAARSRVSRAPADSRAGANGGNGEI